MSREAEVVEALGSVRDPELDEPLPALGFVTEVSVEGDDVRVRLRLPTYFCAPNFAYLMVAAARREVERIEWAERVEILLEDHFSATEINRSVADESGFEGAFPGEVDGDVTGLVDLFARKALMARQGRLAEAAERAGAGDAELATMTLAALPASADRTRVEELREQLGLPSGEDSPAFLTPDGSRVDADQMSRFLRLARLIRVSIDGNSGLCRGLLATRYQLPAEEVTA